MTMVKPHKKKMSKLFFYDGVVKCGRNLNPEKMDTASYTGKNDGAWWGIFKEFLKQNIIMAVLRKANAHSVFICRLIKKSIMQMKIDPRGKIDSNFFAYSFSKESYVVHISFLQKKRLK